MSKDSLLAALCCPECKGQLDDLRLACVKCRESFQHESNKYIFAAPWKHESHSESDWLNGIKSKLKKRLGRKYQILIEILSPVYCSISVRKWLEARMGGLILNLGGGTSYYGEGVINVDLANYADVNVVANIERLPFKDHSVNHIISMAVLEHVENPELIVLEINRVLKPGGSALIFVPFIQGFHASPDDFRRYTSVGLRKLFEKFEVKRVVSGGPTSGMLWIFQEWLAIVLSFGFTPLYKLIYLTSMVLSPLKYLDYFYVHHSQAKQIATGFYVEIEKGPR